MQDQDTGHVGKGTVMSKEYERIRQEVSKKYRDEIDCLKMQNKKLAERLNEKDKECRKLQLELDMMEGRRKGASNDALSGLFKELSDICGIFDAYGADRPDRDRGRIRPLSYGSVSGHADHPP